VGIVISSSPGSIQRTRWAKVLTFQASKASVESARAVRGWSESEALSRAGHHPTLDYPATLAELIDEFVSADVDERQPTRSTSTD